MSYIQIPLPGTPPIPIAVLPTQGKDTAQGNATLLMRARALFAEAKVAVIATSSDGAANEVGAHDILNRSEEATGHVEYSLEQFGIHLRAPIFEGTGPLVTIPDALHLGKVVDGLEYSLMREFALFNAICIPPQRNSVLNCQLLAV
jgi:hypothetical protein